MRRRGAAALIALAAFLAAARATSHPSEVQEQAGPGRRLAAATADSLECLSAALYIIPALPNVRDAAVFQLVRATYIDTVKGLAPAGAISNVIPTLVEHNSVKGGVSVHTTVLFSGSCEAGRAAARALHVKLLGDVRPLFYVPAPRAKSLFGDVHMITVGFPYLADSTGAKLVSPAAPAGTNLAAQFSITWEDVPPSKIGELQAAAFKAAILKQLPAGAGVYFTTMITQGVSHRYGNHWRANAAAVSPAVAAQSKGKTSQGGEVWPPGQPHTTRAGRLVFNTNIHGTVFNTAAGKATLAQFMQLLRSNTAAVFPPRHFGRMALAPGYGLRLVSSPAFPCTCETVPPPTLTLAQAYGPFSATATAAGSANVTWVRWLFTATPSSGSGAAITQEADTPLVWFYDLAADTPYTVSVAGVTASGTTVQGANTLAIRTSLEGAPTVAAATPTSATQATVLLTPPTNGQAVSLYIVNVCLEAQPSSCVSGNSTNIQLAFTGLTAGASYLVSATAKIGSTLVPASNTLPLTMPARNAPVLLTAVATSALTGAATATAPGGTTFSKYVFTAIAPSGAPNATSAVTDPLTGSFTGLSPATQYDVTVVGYTGATASPPSNTLSFVTPAANAPLNTGTPTTPFLVTVQVVPPTLPPVNGGSWITFDVTLCPIAGPQSACVTQRVGGAGRRLLDLTGPTANFNAVPGTTYNSVTVAFSPSGEQSKPSMPAQVTTPPVFPWSVAVVPNSVEQTTAAISITPPEFGTIDFYELSVCPKPASGAPNWDACPKTNCLPNQADGCEVSGLSAATAYAVSGLGYTGNKVASVRSSPASFTTKPWPAPTIGEVEAGTVDLSTATVEVIRPDTVPATGWSSYRLEVCGVNPAGGCAEQSCTPVRAPPTPTLCTLTGLNQSTTYSVRARAVKGAATSVQSPAKSLTTLQQDAPTLVSVTPIGSTSGLACLKAPTLGGPWTGGFQCKSCYNGACKDAPKCSLEPTRRLLAAGCDPDSVLCTLGDELESVTSYTVSCVALAADDTPSAVSNTQTLTTGQPSAPDVATSPSDPVLLTCQPSPGRVWRTCEVQLCERPPTRRRLQQGPCQSPITKSCEFTASGTGPCNINMTGTAIQNTIYDITQRTSVMADGLRKSLSAAGGTYTLAPFPLPEISVLNPGGIGTKTYTVSITPNAALPLIFYPAGSWYYYRITANSATASNVFTDCVAARSAAGAPQPTTCTVTVDFDSLPIQWTAEGIQGDPANPLRTDLRTFPSPPFTPPSIVKATGLGNTIGSVCVVPEVTLSDPYVNYECEPCPVGGTCGQPQTCTQPIRRRLEGFSGGVGNCDSTGGTECFLSGLAADTPFEVTCVGIFGNDARGGRSNKATFSTTNDA